jgi:transcriptional regulator with XRE-family HTH domain
MAKYPRRKPKRLTEKLLQIRTALDLSQTDMVRQLGLTKDIGRENISGYEIGRTEPTLPVLLEYARVAGVCLDVLVDDNLNLPAKLPSTPQHSGTGVSSKRRGSTTR